MTALKSYINLQIVKNYSAEIKLNLEIFTNIPVCLSVNKFGNEETKSKIFSFTTKYLQSQLRQLNIMQDNPGQVTGLETGQAKCRALETG